MTSVNRVKIMVDGKTFTLMGQESTEHIQRVAEYIDQKMREIRGTSTSITMDSSLAYVLTSLNIGDDYFKTLREKEELLERLKEAQEYLDEIDKNWQKTEEQIRQKQSRLQETERSLQEDYDQLRDEYNILQDTANKLVKERENFQWRLNELQKDIDRLQSEKKEIGEENRQLKATLDKKQNDGSTASEIQKMQEMEIQALRIQLEEADTKIKKLERSRQDCEFRAKNLEKARIDAENRLDGYLMALEGGSLIGGAERGQNRVKNKKR